MELKNYLSPAIELIEFEVEVGFANSQQGINAYVKSFSQGNDY